MLKPNEPIFLPYDVEAGLVGFLNEELPKYIEGSVWVSTRRQKNSTYDYEIVLYSIDGSGSRFDTQSVVVLEIWGQDEDKVFSVSSIVSGLMRVSPQYREQILSVEITSSIEEDADDDTEPNRLQTFLVTSKKTYIERK